MLRVEGVRHRGFPRALRVTRKRDFVETLRKGRRTDEGPVVLVARGNDLGRERVAVVAGRKAGGAVERNRMKRVVREYFRTRREDFPRGCDLLVLARPGAASLTNEEIRRALASGLSRARRQRTP